MLPCFTFNSSTFGRRIPLTPNTGQSHTASRHYSSIDAILEKECSLGDRVRSQCRLAFSTAQNGGYAAAQDSLASLYDQIKGNLKLEQRVSAFARLIALLQAIRKYVLTLLLLLLQNHRVLTRVFRSDNVSAAQHHLSHLLPLYPAADPELTHQIALLEITLKIRSRQLPNALSKISSLLSGPSTDLAQTLHLLTLKASVFAAAGKPEKGFSLVIRAASRAERAGLVPVLLEALVELAGILTKLGEFNAAREVIEAALPQVSPDLLHAHHRRRILTKLARLWSAVLQICRHASSSFSHPPLQVLPIRPLPPARANARSIYDKASAGPKEREKVRLT